jgi:mannose-6-phosphate isomerase-like protein (cupin superfamily)
MSSAFEPLPAAAGILRSAGAGKQRGRSSAGGEVTIWADAEDTGGRWAILEDALPGCSPGTPLHRHREMLEGFYVLSGRPTLYLGERKVEASPGAFLLVPPGLPHAYLNPRPEPARLLVFFAPAGFERYFVEIAELWRRSAGHLPDVGAVAAIAAKFDMEVVGPRPRA